jgi:hypothetical protein
MNNNGVRAPDQQTMQALTGPDAFDDSQDDYDYAINQHRL